MTTRRAYKRSLFHETHSRFCPVCDSSEYHFGGIKTKQCTCIKCGFKFQYDIDYSKLPDLRVTKKNITTHKVFRQRYGIDKNYGVGFFKNRNISYIEFLKNDGILPVDDKRLAYAINNSDLCKKIGTGNYKLHGAGLKFKIERI